MKSGYTLLAPLALSIAVAGCSAPPSESEDPASSEMATTADGAAGERPTALAMADPPGSDVSPTSDAGAVRGDRDASAGAEGSALENTADAGSASRAASDRPSIYNGVYTSAQAARGRAIQERECSACHTPADWSEGRVLTNYTGLSPLDFVEQLKTTMPMDGPGRLSHQEYVDVVSFIFQLNGVPAGQDELPPEGAGIATPRIEYRRR